MDIGLGIALLAGFLSFASPCVLPIVPGYLTFITGMSFDELTDRRGGSQVVVGALIKSLPFVLGFSLVFIALGASASAVGTLLRENLGLMKTVAGLGIMLLGLHLAGVIRIPVLLQEKRLSGEPAAPGVGRAFVAGILFAFGWTPCVGPILAGILTMAATSETLDRGVLLLASYSLGLGVPFVLSAAFLNGFLSLFKGVKIYLRQVELVSGLLLVLVGMLIFSDKLSWVSSRLAFLNPEELLVSEESADPVPPAAAEVTEKAGGSYGDYDFSLTSVDGEPLRLSDYRGKVVLVNFWATWCGPCVVETPSLVRVYNKYKNKGFAVIGVALQSEEDGVKNFIKQYQVPYAMGRDTTNEIGLRYQVFALPSSFLFSSEGKVKRAFTGFVTESALEKELQKLLGSADAAPPPEGVSYTVEPHSAPRAPQQH
ncbi:MAG: redoxin domain-containing protein [Deltaproteobacteria bacterium]|nr:redoxin domain-containing protein [Deltaproteobacteria bacterium]